MSCCAIRCIFLTGLALSGVAVAQEDESSALDRIEVTGSRISYRDLLDTPAIGITKRGDYLSQTFVLINDTRDEKGRSQELHATIDKLLERSAKRYTILYGENYPIELDRSNYKVDLAAEGKRPDVSRVTLRIKVGLNGSVAEGNRQVEALREFLRSTPKVGRTELDLEADTALGMNRPERYRYELIDAIAADSHRIRSSMGNDCKIDLDGLNSRIEWERVGPVELLLYVPYTMMITGCGAR